MDVSPAFDGTVTMWRSAKGIVFNRGADMSMWLKCAMWTTRAQAVAYPRRTLAFGIPCTPVAARSIDTHRLATIER